MPSSSLSSSAQPAELLNINSHWIFFFRIISACLLICSLLRWKFYFIVLFLFVVLCDSSLVHSVLSVTLRQTSAVGRGASRAEFSWAAMLTLASKLKRDDAGKTGRATGAPDSTHRVSIRDRLLTKGTALIAGGSLSFWRYQDRVFVVVIVWLCTICTALTSQKGFILIFIFLPWNISVAVLLMEPMVLSQHEKKICSGFLWPAGLFASERPFVCVNQRSQSLSVTDSFDSGLQMVFGWLQAVQLYLSSVMFYFFLLSWSWHNIISFSFSTFQSNTPLSCFF